MRAVTIEAAPFTFTDVLDVRIHKGVNQIGDAWIKGVIADEYEDDYARMATKGLPVEVTAIDLEGNRETIFRGVLDDMDIGMENGLPVLELYIASYCSALDREKDIKVFQDTTLTYDELVAAMLEPFGDADSILNCGEGQAIGQMIAQYRETAWAFLARMAGMWEDVLLPDDTKEGIRLYFGFPRKHMPDTPPVSPVAYEIHRGNDSIFYIVKDREIREPGEPTVFQGRELYVTKAESRYEGQELMNTYTLKSREGIRVKPYRNNLLIGASLSGHVSATIGSHVKINLPEAHANGAKITKWHPFSTVYSSPDGMGWYAMPEEGDTLRLYFPTEVEDDGYTISAVHEYGAPQVRSEQMAQTPESDRNDALAYDPENKYISNSKGQTIVLTPDSIRMHSEGGSVVIHDNEGILIASNYSLSITGNGDVNVESMGANAVVAGAGQVYVKQEEPPKPPEPPKPKDSIMFIRNEDAAPPMPKLSAPWQQFPPVGSGIGALPSLQEEGFGMVTKSADVSAATEAAKAKGSSMIELSDGNVRFKGAKVDTD